MGKCDTYMSYQTVKVVAIRSKILSLIYYGMLLLVLGFVIGWVIVYKHGYQREVPMIGSSMVKTKGNAFFINETTGAMEVWDSIDVVNPPVEDGAAFLTTNFMRTMEQTRGACDSTDHCKTNADCAGPSSNQDSGGIRTGNCTADGFCQVYAWCPVEQTIKPRDTFNFLKGVEDFTTFFRVSVNFPSAKKRVDNASPFLTAGEILHSAGTHFEEVQQLGAIIAISYDWDCNLDRNLKYCVPNVTYHRLDDPTSSFSTGFNYRYADHYMIRNQTTNQFTEFRNLFKVYGIRYVVLVSGSGRIFDIKNLATNLGSGLAMLSIAAVVSDLLLVYILPKRALYKQVKVKEMEKFIDETDNEAPGNINSYGRDVERPSERDALLP
jgi:hypothetical protein